MARNDNLDTPSSRHGRYSVEPISFVSGGITLRGNLYLPSDTQAPAPAVPILGPYCLVTAGLGARDCVRPSLGRSARCSLTSLDSACDRAPRYLGQQPEASRRRQPRAGARAPRPESEPGGPPRLRARERRRVAMKAAEHRATRELKQLLPGCSAD